MSLRNGGWPRPPDFTCYADKGRERGGHPGATLLPRRDPLPPAATRTPSAHRTAARRPPANPRPTPPTTSGLSLSGGRGAEIHGASPVVRVRGKSPTEGRVRGFGEKILKIHALWRHGQLPSWQPPPSEERENTRCLRRCAAHAPLVPSAHALFYPQRLRPHFMLVFSDPFSQSYCSF